jgi:LDH2 family malate/lactate/ureidoglycolate dehydrogenase
MTEAASNSIPAEQLSKLVARLFIAAGLPQDAAQTVAEGLTDADLEGMPSHGVMLTDMYIDRIQQGSVSLETSGVIVSS